MAAKWIRSCSRRSKLFTVDYKQLTSGCADLRKRVFVTLSFLVTIVIVGVFPSTTDIDIVYTVSLNRTWILKS